MKINAKTNGEILCEGDSDEVGGVTYDGPVPDDFRATYALGKYRFVDGEIVENPEFVMPEFESPEI